MISQTTVPQGITYQGLARDASNNIINNQAINLKIGIYAPSINGTLVWEETHAVTTNTLGIFYFIIGQGTSTGAGSSSSFSQINWGSANHFVKIAMDETGGTNFVDLDTIQFWSVPYAMYSQSSGNINQIKRISQLSDVDTVGVINGSVLKWNGNTWIIASDNNSDTAKYAYNSAHSSISDTATFALNATSAIDTVLFSYKSDTANYALNSSTSSNSTHSVYSDTATYALGSGSFYTYWNLTGNTGTNPSTNFIGTSDNTDFVVKTNNIERMRYTSNGKIGIGTSTPISTVHIVGNDGLIETGTFGSGTTLSLGAGTRMHWYPKKSAFRVGTANGTEWDDTKIGIYSFATGSGTTASGAYSTALGRNTSATGSYSIASGDGGGAFGLASIAMGSACTANGPYSIAMGRGTVANDTGSVSIAYHSDASGKYANAFGFYTSASGDYSTSMGYYASTGNQTGSFVYCDQTGSTALRTKNTANNQFMVKATGGTIFYTDVNMTMGVSLPAGGGAWASVSDKNKKEHFRKENANTILKKISELEITTWNYKTQSSEIRHIGPMAQDFYSAFKLGESDSTITTIDIDGINLIAIQALANKTKELKQKAEEVQQLKKTIEKLEKEKNYMEVRITAIEKEVLNQKTSTRKEN